VFSAREECNDGEVGIGGTDSTAKQRRGKTKAKGEGGVVCRRGCAWLGSDGGGGRVGMLSDVDSGGWRCK
jgi:hypothetical protein